MSTKPLHALDIAVPALTTVTIDPLIVIVQPSGTTLDPLQAFHQGEHSSLILVLKVGLPPV